MGKRKKTSENVEKYELAFLEKSSKFLVPKATNY
jgi:hypothetical protein